MKKLIIILAVGLSLPTYSQVISSLTVSPNTVCACDSVLITFKYKSGASSSTKFNLTAESTFSTNSYVLSTITPTQISLMSYTVGVVDVYYSYKVKIPCGVVSGVNSQFKLSFNTNAYDYLFVKDCTVGIEEYEMDGQEVKYYNFNGQIVQPKQGELLIKQVGKTRIKILIQ